MRRALNLDANPWLELRRKRAHVLPGLIPFVMWFVPHEDPLPAWNLAVVALCVAGLTAIGLLNARTLRRGREENWARTCVTYAVPPLLVLILFPHRAEFAAAVLAILAFGDASAAIAGRLWGRRRLPWNPDKTWVGLGCFIVPAALLGTFAFWGEAMHVIEPGAVAAPVSSFFGRGEVGRSAILLQAAICATAGALPAALAESIRSRVDDNLRISVAAAVGVVVAGLWLFPG